MTTSISLDSTEGNGTGPWVPWRVYTRDMDRVLLSLDRLSTALESSNLTDAHEAGQQEANTKKAVNRRGIWLLAIAAGFTLLANTFLNIAMLTVR